MSEAEFNIKIDSRMDGVTSAVRARGKGPGALDRLLSGFGRQLRGWGYGLGLYRHRLKGRHPLQLLGSPDDPAPGNEKTGRIILGGDMPLPGGDLPINDSFWRTLALQDHETQAYAHSFHWLQDLAQVGDQVRATQRAELLMQSWFTNGEHYDPLIWEAETLARRLTNWIAHAPLVLSRGDLIYRSQVLTQMARQARHLMRVACDARPGLGRIYTSTALMLAGLLLPGGKSWRNKGQRLLLETLADFVLADGGPRSRNPSDAVKTMQQLVMVRNTLIDREGQVPDQIQGALDRLAPFVRALRHDDGAFAQMNGASAEGGHGTDAILAASDARGKAIEAMTHSGYQRAAKTRAVLIVDAGPPPPPPHDRGSHASIGAFEFSHAGERILCNMGHHNRGDLARLSRTSAAHSTLVVGDRNSSALDKKGGLGRGVRTVKTLRRDSDEGLALSVQHDAYLSRFKVQSERRLWIAADGRQLVGEDRLTAQKTDRLKAAGVTLWFHLAPGLEADLLTDGSLALTTPGGQIWQFIAPDGDIRIEDSLSLPTASSMLPSLAVAVTPHDIKAQSWALTLMDSTP